MEMLYPDYFTYMKLEVDDNNYENLFDKFDSWVEFINSASGKVLVHCWMGMSRSTSVWIAYIMYT